MNKRVQMWCGYNVYSLQGTLRRTKEKKNMQLSVVIHSLWYFVRSAGSAETTKHAKLAWLQEAATQNK